MNSINIEFFTEIDSKYKKQLFDVEHNKIINNLNM